MARREAAALDIRVSSSPLIMKEFDKSLIFNYVFSPTSTRGEPGHVLLDSRQDEAEQRALRGRERFAATSLLLPSPHADISGAWPLAACGRGSCISELFIRGNRG